MTEYRASRTLVKSPPELWSEVSEATSLRRHLDQFGEIRITRLEPEIAVAWEGECARGTVQLEPSGWGTKVIMTARPLPDEGRSLASTATRESASPVEAEMRELRALLELGSQASEARRRGRFMRAILTFLKRRHPPAVLQGSRRPELDERDADDPLGSAAAPALALNSALDSLGRAHHRPYSRA